MPRRPKWELLDIDEKSDSNRDAIQDAMARIRLLEESLSKLQSQYARLAAHVNYLAGVIERRTKLRKKHRARR